MATNVVNMCSRTDIALSVGGMVRFQTFFGHVSQWIRDPCGSQAISLYEDRINRLRSDGADH